jgi:signal transduction histidine kinase
MNVEASKERHVVWSERLSEQISLIDSTVGVVRNLALDLRPSILDDFGLVPAIRWYLKRQLESSEMRGSIIEEDVPENLPSATETACFRVMQEAVTNILKHAQASNIMITIGRTPDGLRLIVRDDGIGFDVDEARRKSSMGESFGLLGMQERLGLLGGMLTIRSTPTEGTEIEAIYPVDPNSSNADDIHKEGNLG